MDRSEGLPLQFELAHTAVTSPWTAADERSKRLPRMSCGDALLVSVNTHNVSLFRLTQEDEAGTSGFDGGAANAWAHSSWALSHSLPCRWKATVDAERDPRAAFLGSIPRLRGSGNPPQVLEGDSFGLAFVLARASMVLDRPLRSDTVALAAIAPNGTITPVCGLEAKIASVLALTPRVRRFLVSRSQKSEALQVIERLAKRASIVGVNRVGEALDRAFRVKPAKQIVVGGRAPRDRAAIVDELLHLALDNPSSQVDWAPVETAVSLALHHWPLSRADRRSRWVLQFVRGVAARHQGREVNLPAVSDRLLKAFGFGVRDRVHIVANYMQHCADVGHPSVPAAMTLARPYLRKDADAFSGHARLMGALARRLAVSGDPPKAMDLQKRAFAILVKNTDYSDTSFQLTEWFRLAGVLGREEEFADAERAFAMLNRRRAFDKVSRLYVDLARAKALVLLDRSDRALDELTRIIVAAIEVGRSEIASSAHRWLERAVGTAPVPQPRVEPASWRLITLDRALRTGNRPAQRRAVMALKKLEPGAVGHLIRGSRGSGLSSAEYVARFYPY